LALGNGGVLDLAPHALVIHISEFFVDHFMPLVPLSQIWVVKSFIKGGGFDPLLFKGFFEVNS